MKTKQVNKYKAWARHNFRDIPQVQNLPPEKIREIEIVSEVLPFKTNNFVTENLINWDDYENDPLFRLTFPSGEMLLPHHFQSVEKALLNSSSKESLRLEIDKIRHELNPHPAGQKELNVPLFEGRPLGGIQHKYRETVLFFPSQGQTCHAYCTFCFRWPQFVGMNELKFAMKEGDLLVRYLRAHPEATDVLFTGGDPLIMRTSILEAYIHQLLDAGLPSLQTIRLGTKAISYWPFRFTTDEDADDLMRLFASIVRRGINLSIMAHFNHPAELEPSEVQKAIARICSTGAQIRTQSPLLRHINDSPSLWAAMWRKQVNLNCIPYYMFIARDTGAQHYFSVPLVRAWEIFRSAYQQVSGICRTVRGPSMSCLPGKVQLLGVTEIRQGSEMKKVFNLRFLQGRNPDWVARPFFAAYDENAVWLDDLRPAFGEENFFFESATVPAAN